MATPFEQLGSSSDTVDEGSTWKSRLPERPQRPPITENEAKPTLKKIETQHSEKVDAIVRALWQDNPDLDIAENKARKIQYWNSVAEGLDGSDRDVQHELPPSGADK
ncbi:MAG: hypothetical protein KBD27_00070 [Candidatus Moranbacteria bacterium]|nr:hypothetical protein [Candidatus Moranbacteria bacterium]